MEKVNVLSVETILSFLRYLFEVKKFSLATVASYKAAIAKPLKLGFDIDVSGQPFVDFIKALHNIKPS